MITILTIGDPHYTDANTVDTIEFEKGCIDLIRERQPDLVVLLGDILDKHGKYDAGPHNRATAFLKILRAEVSSYSGTFLTLIGNHDRQTNNEYLTPIHPFSAFEQTEKFRIAADVQVLSVTSQSENESIKVVAVPYVFPGRFEEAIKTSEEATYLVYEQPEPVVILAHQEFLNAQMGAHKSMAGDVWDLNLPAVISGHVHDHQRLQSNVLYVGTPFQQKYNESAHKTVSMFSIEPGMSAVEILDAEERITLPGLIKKKTIRVTAEELPSIDPDQHENYRVKIVISGTLEERAAVVKSKKYLELKSRPELKLVYKTTAVARTKTEIESDEIGQLASTKKSFVERLRERAAANPRLLAKLDKIGICKN